MVTVSNSIAEEVGNKPTYGIEAHHHLFAAWAASRAASVKGCRFSVEQGRTVLETAGFTSDFATPDQLPSFETMDETHRLWRSRSIEAAKRLGLEFTHGVAAKLINVYLKSRLVCGGFHGDERVSQLHPPIDSVLLQTLADLDVGGHAQAWRRADRTRWSKFSSDEYEQVIALIRDSLCGEPLWKIEEHWRGNQ